MKYLLAATALLTLLSAPALLSTPVMAETIPVASPEGHQPIKASVTDDTPSHFTINVRQLANLGANDEAPTFAIYTASRLPSTCGNFVHTKINYEKPSQYQRVFNLSDKPEVLKAIQEYHCVIIPNIPPAG